MPKPNSIKNKPLTNMILKRLKIAAIAVAIITVILLPFQIPQYGFYYVGCGFKQPVKIVPRGIGSEAGNYILPTSIGYNNEAVFVRGYYCDEQQAQNAGYRKLFNQDGTFSIESSPIR